MRMEYPIAELADKYTILLLKKEHGFNVTEQLNLISPLVVRVPTLNLYEINKKMWNLEEKITSNQHDLALAGKLYLELRELSLQRVNAKNKIAKYWGEPMEDRKY